MTKQERRKDINNRISLAMAERSIQPENSRAYADLTKIIKDIRKEYQSGTKSRIEMRYDADRHFYYGLDTAN